ncbi:MLO-like protein 9 [Salvia splendens]|uniref:MLO-like protein 9 n=1 Tax=Salvia splendens TaxID=180675 RepID=UPI001C26B007|nr:MLO-like protein 9 [Salvia splendens]
MGGGGGGRELDTTPTWAVALVTLVIIVILIILEKTIHKTSHAFEKRRRMALVEALEKIKGELMVLGFISLLLTFGQTYITQVCIPEKISRTMLPCEFKDDHHEEGGGGGGSDAKAPSQEAAHRRRLLSFERRMLGGGSDTPKGCHDGFVPLISVSALHQLHIFIFFLAVFHVFYSAITMMLGRLKIRGWKEWERQIAEETDGTSADAARFRLTHETSFVRSHSNPLMQNPIIFYIVCFFRHILYSVQKPDYSTLRHGFVSVHLSPGTKFDFQKYIKRSLEDDFKVIVGIPPYLWMISCVYLLLNVKGGQVMFILSIFPLLVILAVGTKLQSIITQMAIEIQEKHAVVQGIPLVQVSDRHFWFSKPTLVLHLIHLTLFQNAFEITYFIWITYEFGLHSCFHRYFLLAVIRVCIGVGVQIVCSYITLPLYALVTQMGSHMKKSIFDEQTSKALMSWHNKVKKKHDHDHVPPIRTRKLGECDSSPEHSPQQSGADLAAGAAAIAVAQSSIEMSENSPKEQMTDIDLLSGP